jgi:hypothetical protein
MNTDASFTYEPHPPGKKNLGDFNVVAGVLAEFATRIAGIWTRFTDGELDQQESMAALEAESSACADLFLGRNPAYAPAAWRSEGMLKGKICAWIPGIDPNGDVVPRYFKFVGMQVLKGCQEIQEGMDEAQAAPMLQSVLRDATEKLSGVQP